MQIYVVIMIINKALAQIINDNKVINDNINTQLFTFSHYYIITMAQTNHIELIHQLYMQKFVSQNSMKSTFVQLKKKIQKANPLNKINSMYYDSQKLTSKSFNIKKMQQPQKEKVYIQYVQANTHAQFNKPKTSYSYREKNNLMQNNKSNQGIKIHRNSLLFDLMILKNKNKKGYSPYKSERCNLKKNLQQNVSKQQSQFNQKYSFKNNIFSMEFQKDKSQIQEITQSKKPFTSKQINKQQNKTRSKLNNGKIKWIKKSLNNLNQQQDCTDIKPWIVLDYDNQ